ncbi:Hypothetical protein GLP15_838 [Giardia lamblia P15]|uniref:CKK domain-containing protein n=1 Tax=Giardia intestinalis (strain P15) TaxID=658858 RepID=E1F3V8_GIAIA|nr:Hypothetical protein GLP15_838 [Giardia lamblia P15]
MARVVRPRGLKAQMQTAVSTHQGSGVTGNKTTECTYYDELELSGTVGMFTTRQNSTMPGQQATKTPSFLPDLPRVTSKTETPLHTTKLEEHLKKRLDERDKQISVLTAENEELTAHYATSRAIMDGLQKELEELTAQLKEKTRQLVEKTGQLETEQVITADLLSKFTALQEAHDALQIENSILRKKVEDLTSFTKFDKDISMELAAHELSGTCNARNIHTMQSIAKRLSLDKEEATSHNSSSQISSDRLSDKLALHSASSPEEGVESYITISQGTTDPVPLNPTTGLHASVSKPSDFLEGCLDEGHQRRQRGTSAHNYTAYLDNIEDLDDLELVDQEDNANTTGSYADELRPTREVIDNLKDNSTDHGPPCDDASYSEVYCSRSKSRNTSLLGDMQEFLLNGSLSPHAISHAAELELIIQENESDDCVQASHLSASLMRSHSLVNNNSSNAANDGEIACANTEEICVGRVDKQMSQGDNSINSSGLDSMILGTIRQTSNNTTSKISKVEAECIQNNTPHDTTEGDEAGLVTKAAGAGVALEIMFDDAPNKQISVARNQKLLEAQNQRVQQFKERRAQMRQRELEEAAEQSDLAHSRSSSSILGSPGSNKRSVYLNRRSARPREKQLSTGGLYQDTHVSSSTTNLDRELGSSKSHVGRRNSFSAHTNPGMTNYLDSDSGTRGSGTEGTELVYKVANRPAKSAAQQESHFIEYLPPAKFDNSSFVQKLILHNLLPGTANYERRMLAMDNVSRERGHLLLVFRDTERKSYHSCVKVDELSGSLIKVDGPDNMPNELAQSIIESMLKYDSSSRSFLVVDQRQLSTLVVAITLKVRRKKISGR